MQFLCWEKRRIISWEFNMHILFVFCCNSEVNTFLLMSCTKRGKKTAQVLRTCTQSKLNMPLQWDLPLPLFSVSPGRICGPALTFCNITAWLKSMMSLYWSMTGLLGIQDLSKPDYGDSVHLQPGDIPVFWACSVTGIEAVINCSMYCLWKLLKSSFSLVCACVCERERERERDGSGSIKTCFLFLSFEILFCITLI